MRKVNDSELLRILGLDFLAYVVAGNPQVIENELAYGLRNLSPRQRSVVSRLRRMRQSFHPYGADLPHQRMLERHLGGSMDNLFGRFLPESGTTVANALRREAGGILPAPRADAAPESVIGLLGAVCRDLYPLLLLPSAGGDLEATRYLIQQPLRTHPLRPALVAAIFADPRLAVLFSNYVPDPVAWAWPGTHAEREDPVGAARHNTRSGGGFTPTSLLHDLIRASWRWAELIETRPTFDTFQTAIAHVVEAVGAAATGAAATVPVRAGLAGVVLPPGVDVHLGWGRLRSATATDGTVASRAGIPHTRGNSLSGGGTPWTTIRFCGDVILETTFPYQIEVGNQNLFRDWAAQPRWPDHVTERIDDICLGVALACIGSHVVRVAPAWRYVLDPLGAAGKADWDDVSILDLHPYNLTRKEAAAWGRWTGLVTRHRCRIEVAMRRTTRSLTERRNPDDVILDAVIAWENLFGSPQPGSSHLVRDCLARLLENDPVARPACLKRLSELYALRNRIAHGKPATVSPADEKDALSMTLRVIRALIEMRPDVLNELDSQARRNRLTTGPPL
jgi:hypothetical protein